MKRLIFIIWCVAAAACSRPTDLSELTLIPRPETIISGNGSYKLNSQTRIRYTCPDLEPAARHLQAYINRSTGISPEIGEATEALGGILLTTDTSLEKQEQYTLDINRKEIRVTGANTRSVLLGIQTLAQLLPVAQQVESFPIPSLHISDAPVWGWRGLMLDVARHFFDTEEVKQFLDMMAYYKFNKFHWHLSDDQGWRVEIKKYPLLTEIGGWRTYNNHDRGCTNLAAKESNPDYRLPEKRLRDGASEKEYGGFYTQEEIREVIAYAAERGIDIIPEIDMPGHFSAAIRSYPELSCFGKTGWGTTFSDPICPGKDATVDFCKDIFREIFALFPYEYVHMGADEVEKVTWTRCAHCQKRIRDNQLNDEKELQSWFVRQMLAFFQENGKKLIGWDETTEGGLPEGVTVMWWRTWAPQAARTALSQGNEVILAPNSHNYFDYQQNGHTLRSLYEFDPLPQGTTPQQRHLIKGIQANSWAEWIPSFQRVQYMTTPRLIALSEVCWTTDSLRGWEDFERRLIAHFPRLDDWGINYRPLDLTGFHGTNAFVGTTRVEWQNRLPRVEIYYTTDSTVPDRRSTRYTEPFEISESAHFTIRLFRPDGTAADILRTRYIRQEYRPGDAPENPQPGWKCAWHETVVNRCHLIESVPVKQEYVVDRIAIPPGVGGKRGLIYTGYVVIDKPDIYTFTLGSDDGSMLYVGDSVVVDNDGPHGPITLSGQIALGAGAHPVKLCYFDMNNGGFLQLRLHDAAGNEIELSGDRLFH